MQSCPGQFLIDMRQIPSMRMRRTFHFRTCCLPAVSLISPVVWKYVLFYLSNFERFYGISVWLGFAKFLQDPMDDQDVLSISEDDSWDLLDAESD